MLSQDESRAFRHNYIGTEHLLLGLLREEEGLAARVLESLEITLEEVRAQVARIVGHGDDVTSGQIPFTPRAKKVLELSLREALSLGHNYIGTEHILLGLVRENNGVAARILLDFDADAEKIRNEIIRMLSGPNRGSWETQPGGPARPASAPPARWHFRIEPWPAPGGAEGLELLESLGEEGWQIAGVVPSETGPEVIFQRRAHPGERLAANLGPVEVPAGITVGGIATALGISRARVVAALSSVGGPPAPDHELSAEQIELLAGVLGRKIVVEPGDGG